MEPSAHQTSDASRSEDTVFQRLDRTPAYPYRLRDYARRTAWEWVQWLLIRPSPRRAHGWRRFWLERFGASFGKASGTKASTKVTHPWLLSIGAYSMVAEGVVIYNLGPVSIGDHSVISQDAYLCAGTHDYTRPDLPLQRPPIKVGSGVWICAGAFIGPGVTIGDNAVVGARAVVTRDVPAGVVVAGNPARVIKTRKMIHSDSTDPHA
jgi:putative colanic acid biosynthesis acetyltransferase WcaF